MRDAENGTFVVGEWQIESRLNRMSRGEQIVRLEPKIMRVLLCLSEHPKRVYSKDELIATVWSESVVTEDVLARAISELRRAFGDDPRSPTYIETIHKTGYRLIAAVQPAKSTSTQRARTQKIVFGSIVVVAVLALGWLFNDRENMNEPTNWRLTPATALPGQEVRPALSPDGQSFLFSWTEEDKSNLDVYLKRFDDPEATLISDGVAQAGGAVWSPSGEELAYLRVADDQCSVIVRTLENSEDVELASCNSVGYPDLRWSHDGRWLAYNDRVDDEPCHSIVLVDVTDGTQRKLTQPATSDWGDYDPVFSHDDNALFFARAKSEGIQDLYRVNIETGEETQLTSEGRNIYGIDLSAEGDSLIYSSNRGGQHYELWKIPVDGGEAVLYMSGTVDVVNPSLSADGNSLLFEQRSYDHNIWLTDLENPDAGAPFAPSSRWEMYPAISNDGTRVAFASNRSGSYEIWVADLDGNNPIQLTDFGEPLSASPRWSPSDDALVFVSRPDGNADLFSVATDGMSDPVRIGKTPYDEVAPSWSANGEHIYYGSNETGVWQIRRQSKETGESVQITEDGGFSALESPDGRSLYFARQRDAGLWRIPVAGGGEELIYSPLEPGDWGNWGLFDDGIYVVIRDGAQRVMHLDFDGSEVATLFELPRRIPPGEIAIAASRDGQYLLYVQIDMRRADIISAKLE